MKNRPVEDERVLMQKRKILSEAYAILMFLLLGSMLVKQFILNAPFVDYCVEYFGFFGISIYVLVRNYISGNNLFKARKGKNITSIAISVIIIAVITTIVTEDATDLNAVIKPLLINLAIAILVVFSIYFIFGAIAKSRQKKLENKYDDE